MAAPARGRYWKEPTEIMRMQVAYCSALVSGVSKEGDIFERTRAFAMDELHYDTMAASCLDFNAKTITTAPEAAGQACVSKLDGRRRLYIITESVPESQLKKVHWCSLSNIPTLKKCTDMKEAKADKNRKKKARRRVQSQRRAPGE